MRDLGVLEALFPGPRRLVLTAIFGEPERWWSIPELAGRAGIQTGSLRQHMVLLREGGVIRERQDEESRPWFQADPTCPIFGELRSIVARLAPQSQGGETILVVEDQQATARITRILLESWGYRVLEAHCGAEAIALFEDHSGRVQLLLTDVIMPEMTGPVLAKELVRRSPQLRVVFMSGYPNDELTDGGISFLPKPFNPASLSKIVRKELDRTAGRRMNLS